MKEKKRGVFVKKLRQDQCPMIYLNEKIMWFRIVIHCYLTCIRSPQGKAPGSLRENKMYRCASGASESESYGLLPAFASQLYISPRTVCTLYRKVSDR